MQVHTLASALAVARCQVRAADGSSVSISFSFPEKWITADGPNLDVRDVKESDSAYLLVRELPASSRGKIEKVSSDWFLDVLFDPQGKYGAVSAWDPHLVAWALECVL